MKGKRKKCWVSLDQNLLRKRVKKRRERVLVALEPQKREEIKRRRISVEPEPNASIKFTFFI